MFCLNAVKKSPFARRRLLARTKNVASISGFYFELRGIIKRAKTSRKRAEEAPNRERDKNSPADEEQRIFRSSSRKLWPAALIDPRCLGAGGNEVFVRDCRTRVVTRMSRVLYAREMRKPRT